MKIEFLHHYRHRHPLSRRERLIAYLPRYAPYASRLAPLLNLRNQIPALARLGERWFGLSAARRLPQWSGRPYPNLRPRPTSPPHAGEEGSPQRGDRVGVPADREVVLLVDTFNRWFEPENARAAERLLARAGYRVVGADAARDRPLCCGRTFLTTGLVEEAREEARCTVAALTPFVRARVPIIGLEPSCLLTVRDEFPAILPGAETKALATHVQLFEEFATAERAAGRFALPLKPMPGQRALLHGHCHQKAFATIPAAVGTLRLIPELDVETFDSTCCGMAGAFGYEAEHYEMSLKIGELGVLPKMREAAPGTILAACGTSCRHQIADATGRKARHLVRILEDALA